MSKHNTETENLLAQAKAAEPKAISVRGASRYLDVIKELRDHKNYSWAEIAHWFSEHGIVVGASRLNYIYVQDRKAKRESK